jgi:peptidoglycan LD-endopeptidase CwlK
MKLSSADLKELKGVNPKLVEVVRLAATYTTIDFAVHDGLRTIEEQERYVATGVSTTMNSKHLKGLAVDNVPLINGKKRWEWVPLFSIAHAMQRAAIELGVTLRWGGVWDKTLNELGRSPKALQKAVDEYVARRKAVGRRAFIDGPHFELV